MDSSIYLKQNLSCEIKNHQSKLKYDQIDETPNQLQIKNNNKFNIQKLRLKHIKGIRKCNDNNESPMRFLNKFSNNTASKNLKSKGKVIHNPHKSYCENISINKDIEDILCDKIKFKCFQKTQENLNVKLPRCSQTRKPNNSNSPPPYKDEESFLITRYCKYSKVFASCNIINYKPLEKNNLKISINCHKKLNFRRNIKCNITNIFKTNNKNSFYPHSGQLRSIISSRNINEFDKKQSSTFNMINKVPNHPVKSLNLMKSFMPWLNLKNITVKCKKI